MLNSSGLLLSALKTKRGCLTRGLPVQMHAVLTFIPKNLIFLLYIQLWLTRFFCGTGSDSHTRLRLTEFNDKGEIYLWVPLPSRCTCSRAIVQTTSLISVLLRFSSIAILKIACNHVPPRSATFDFSAIRFHQFFVHVSEFESYLLRNSTWKHTQYVNLVYYCSFSPLKLGSVPKQRPPFKEQHCF